MRVLRRSLLSAVCAHGAVYDYVVAGGGTAGLTVAARLSEDPNRSILVLEAGEDRSNDIEILAPGLLTSLYSDPKYDWNFHTVPQFYANDHVIAHPRGKQLGGSSAINFLWWTHASQQDINNWGLLGNKNWSWDVIEPFFRRSEHYFQPTEMVQQALRTQYTDKDLHGESGPISTTFADIYGELDEAWPRTYEALGLSPSSDPRDGLALGGYTNLLNLKMKDRSRSYAATTYLRDAEERPNFKVVTGAHVERILFDTACEKPRAIGVAYTENNDSLAVYAKKEVILSAGAFGSPHILELSGIGDPEVLQPHGLEVIVNNTNVGENLQDHAHIPLGYQVRPGIFTLDDLANETIFNEAYEQYIKNRTGLLATTSAMSALLSLNQFTSGNNTSLERAIHSACHNISSTSSSSQYSLLCTALRTEAIVQEFGFPAGINPTSSNDSSALFLAPTPGNFFTINGVLEHPFSRGNVHISSLNPLDHPRIGQRYLEHPLDVQMLEAIEKHLQQVVKTPPLSDLLVDNGTVLQPGYEGANTSHVEDFIRDHLQSEYLPCGTCAMLPRGEGGVVGEKLRVYGVGGLRIVDASVFPMIPRANLQSLVYAVAERAVEFVTEDWE